MAHFQTFKFCSCCHIRDVGTNGFSKRSNLIHFFCSLHFMHKVQTAKEVDQIGSFGKTVGSHISDVATRTKLESLKMCHSDTALLSSSDGSTLPNDKIFSTSLILSFTAFRKR